MSEKKNPPMPPRSEEDVVFGDELPVLPIRSTETPDAAAQAMRQKQLEGLGYVEPARPR